jgi:hypothetical protein
VILHAGEGRPSLIPLARLFVALAFICRPLTAPLVVPIAGYVASITVHASFPLSASAF